MKWLQKLHKSSCLTAEYDMRPEECLNVHNTKCNHIKIILLLFKTIVSLFSVL